MTKTKPKGGTTAGVGAAHQTQRTDRWLFKSEPDVFSWEDLKSRGAAGEQWDGVRNYLARNNMRSMRIGDLGFFYHSNAGKDIVGVCMVCAEAHPDTSTDDDRWECVDVRAVIDMPTPVSLAEVKATPELGQMSLVTSMRLSVQPVTADEWKLICKMGGLSQKAIADAVKALAPETAEKTAAKTRSKSSAKAS